MPTLINAWHAFIPFSPQEDSEITVSATWVISFNRIKEKSSVVADLLSFMSFLDRQYILKHLLPRGTGPLVEYNKALETLKGYPMIRL